LTGRSIGEQNKYYETVLSCKWVGSLYTHILVRCIELSCSVGRADDAVDYRPPFYFARARKTCIDTRIVKLENLLFCWSKTTNKMLFVGCIHQHLGRDQADTPELCSSTILSQFQNQYTFRVSLSNLWKQMPSLPSLHYQKILRSINCSETFKAFRLQGHRIVMIYLTGLLETLFHWSKSELFQIFLILPAR
jgi:hypothetical protein